MSPYSSLVDILQQNCFDKSTSTAYTFLEDGENLEVNISFQELDLSAKSIAGYLQQYYKPGDRVLLFFSPGLDFIKSFYGCMYAGLVAVPSFPPKMNRSFERLNSIIKNAEAKAILTNIQLSEKIRPQLQGAKLINVELLFSGYTDLWKAPGTGTNDIAFLQYTSGSTGSPKGVVITHGNIIHNQGLIKNAFCQNDQSIVVGWLPFYHDMGLIGNIIHPAYLGARSVLMSPLHFLQKPFRWLEAISKYKGTTSGGPNFSFDLCVNKISEEQRDTLDLSSWDVAFCGAEPVQSVTLTKFGNFFKSCGFNPNVFQACYGMAEATLLITAEKHHTGVVTEVFLPADLDSYKNENGSISSEMELVRCGIPKESDLVIVNPDGEPAKNCTVGEIWVKGNSIAHGYWNNQEETRRNFNLYLPNGHGPYFKTGDLGLLKQGGLFLVGRIKDLIIINGKNYYSHDIESTILNKINILVPGACAAVSTNIMGQEKLVVIAEATVKGPNEIDDAIQSIKESIFEEYELTVHDVVLLRRGTIPKTTSGKIQRFECRSLYNADKLHRLEKRKMNALVSEDHPDFNYTQDEKRVLIILNELLNVVVKPGQDINLLGMDSIKTSQAVILLSEEFNKELPYDIILENRTISLLTARIVEKEIKKEPEIESVTEKTVYAASPMQTSIWFNELLNPRTNCYNIPVSLKIGQGVSHETIENAFNHIIEKYDILRTCFVLEELPMQKIISFEPFRVTSKKIGTEESVEQYLKLKSKDCFDLTQYPLWRAEIIQNYNGENYLLLVIHHIITDGYSLNLIYKELNKLCQLYITKQPVLLERPVNQYKDYSEWLINNLKSDKYKMHVDYWTEQLKGAIPNVNLAIDRDDKYLNREGATQKLEIPIELFSKIEKLSKDLHVSLYTTFLSAYGILIQRLTMQTDLLIGIPVINRESSETINMPGPLLNTIMLRMFVNVDETIYDHIIRNKFILSSGLSHQSLPFSQVIEHLKVPTDNSNFPLSSVFFNGLNFLEENDADVLNLASFLDTGLDVNFDLNCYLIKKNDSVTIRLDYRKCKFTEISVFNILTKFQEILLEIVENPAKNISEIVTNSQDIATSLIQDADWYGKDASLLNVFYTQFQKFKDNIAVSSRVNYTYGELNVLSNRWARVIRSEVKTNGYVVFCVGHNENLAVSIISILKSGNAYVPVDPDYPRERIKSILIEIKPSLVITDSQHLGLVKELNPEGNFRTINIDDRSLISNISAANLNVKEKKDGIAYVLYTSGSTGKPKGIKQSHNNILHFISNYTGALNINDQDKLTGFSSCCYDSFNNDFYGAILNGATYFPLSLKDNSEGSLISDWITDHKITIWHSIPTVFRFFANHWIENRINLASLRLIKMTGEAVRKDHFDAFKSVSAKTCKFIVSLGCTEATLISIGQFDHDYLPSKSILPVGFPVNRTKVWIASEELKPLGILEVGEIVVENSFVSPGSVGNDGEGGVFFSLSGQRCYRTGDLGRKMPDGNIEWLARKTGYFKINGVRVESAEIEYQILKHALVTDAVVVYIKVNGCFEIVCFYLAKMELSANVLNEFVNTSISLAALPRYYIRLMELPRTPTGKIDRKSLMAPLTIKQNGVTASEINTELEGQLVEIWKKILDIDSVSIQASFFAIGGNSIKAMQLIQELNRLYTVQMSINKIFEYQTISRLASYLTLQRKSRIANIKKQLPQDSYRLSNAQLRIWIQSQLVPYNITGAYNVYGNLDVVILNRAFAALLDKHEILRTIFIENAGTPRQKILAPKAFSFNVETFNFQEDPGREQMVEAMINNETLYKFNLELAPLIRVNLIQVQKLQYVLTVTVHHIISDGWSMQVLARDVFDLYKKFKNGCENESVVLPFQYKDYAEWINERLEEEFILNQREYWKEKLDRLPSVNLPLDKPRPKIKSFTGAVVEGILEESSTLALKQIADENGTTIFVILLSAFKILIHKITDQKDITIGTLSAGREFSGLEHQIGLYAQTLALRTKIENEKSISEFIQSVKLTVMNAFDNQLYPIDHLASDLNIHRDPSRSLFFDIVFILHPNKDTLEEISHQNEFSVIPIPKQITLSKFDLTLNLYEKENEITLTAEYNSDLFEQMSIVILIERLKYLIYQIKGNLDSPIQKLEVDFPQEELLNSSVPRIDFNF